MLKRLSILLLLAAASPMSAQSLDEILSTVPPGDASVLPQIIALAEGGDARAQVSAAMRLLASEDVAAQEEGVVFAVSAGEAGLGEGWYLYGLARDAGLGTREQSRSSAHAAFELSAGTGYAPGISAYLKANSSESAEKAWDRYVYDYQNTDNPKRLLRKQAALVYAAMNGHAQARHHLGSQFARSGDPEQEKIAFQLYLAGKSGADLSMRRTYYFATQGDAEAMREIGASFLRVDLQSSMALPESEFQGVRWYLRAIEAGSVEAMSDLGWYYAVDGITIGKGPHIAEAAALLSEAARKGSTTAAERLARLETAVAIHADRAASEARLKAFLTELALAIVFNDAPVEAQSWTRDNCAGIDGIGYFDSAAGDAAAIFGGCSKY